MPKLEVKRLSEALIALAGIWLTVTPLPSLVSGMFATAFSPGVFQDVDPASLASMQIAYYLSSAIVGAALIMLRKPIARWLSPDESGSSVTAQCLFAVGVALLGMSYLVSGITSFSSLLMLSMANGPPVNIPHLERFWGSITDLVAGLCLFGLSIHIARLWQWLRGRLDESAESRSPPPT